VAVLSNIVMEIIVLSLAWTRRIGYHSVVVVLLVALTTVEIILKF